MPEKCTGKLRVCVVILWEIAAHGNNVDDAPSESSGFLCSFDLISCCTLPLLLPPAALIIILLPQLIFIHPGLFLYDAYDAMIIDVILSFRVTQFTALVQWLLITEQTTRPKAN